MGLPSGSLPSGALPRPTLPDSFRSMCQLPTFPSAFFRSNAKMAWPDFTAFIRSAASPCSAPWMFSNATEEGKASGRSAYQHSEPLEGEGGFVRTVFKRHRKA